MHGYTTSYQCMFTHMVTVITDPCTYHEIRINTTYFEWLTAASTAAQPLTICTLSGRQAQTHGAENGRKENLDNLAFVELSNHIVAAMRIVRLAVHIQKPHLCANSEEATCSCVDCIDTSRKVCIQKDVCRLHADLYWRVLLYAYAQETAHTQKIDVRERG